MILCLIIGITGYHQWIKSLDLASAKLIPTTSCIACPFRPSCID